MKRIKELLSIIWVDLHKEKVVVIIIGIVLAVPFTGLLAGMGYVGLLIFKISVNKNTITNATIVALQIFIVGSAVFWSIEYVIRKWRETR